MLFCALCLTHLICNFISAHLLGGSTSRTALALRAGLLSYFTFFMIPVAVGAASGYMNGFVLLSGILAAAGLCIYLYIESRKDSPAPNTLQPLSKIPKLEWVLVLFLLLVVTLSFLAGLTLPPRTFDVPSYHMTNSMRWLVTGRFVIDAGGDAMLSPSMACAITVPNMKAVFPYASMLLTGSSNGAGLTQFPFYLLLLLAVKAICRRLGMRGWAGTVAAVAVACVPEVFLQSTDACSDVISTTGIMLCLWTTLVLIDQRRVIDFFCAATALGILAGSKSPSVAAAVGLLGVMVALLLYLRLRKKSTTSYVTDALFIGFAFFFILWNCGSWTLRAWSQFGNPFYPFQVALGGHTFFEGPIASTVNQNLVHLYTGATGSQAVWNTWRETIRPVGFSSWSGGFGYAAFAFGLPAAAAYFLSGWRKKPESWFFAHGVILFLLALSPTHSVARLVLFEGVWVLIAAAYVLSIAPLALAILLAVGLAGASVFSMGMAIPYVTTLRRPPEMVMYNILSGHARGALLTTYPDEFTALDYWLDEVSKPGLRLAVPRFFSIWTAFNAASPADILRVRDKAAGESLNDYHKMLLANKVTHSYVLRNTPVYQEMVNSPLFRLEWYGLDSHAAPPWPGAILPKPDSAVFTVTGAS